MEAVRVLGHFDLIAQVGSGAFGSVWRARDTKLDRTVAVKIPRKGQLSSQEIEQFVRQAAAGDFLRLIEERRQAVCLQRKCVAAGQRRFSLP